MPSIFVWPCSHYRNADRKWVYGGLELHINGLVFVENLKEKSVTNTSSNLTISFVDVNQVKRATSTLVYNCIVVQLASEKLWFSSFDNRDNVFYTIQHFMKEQLIGASSMGSDNPNQELLQLVYNTQDTLMGASRVLHEQGKQISHATSIMNNLHNDITVAERITGDIDSWFGAWRIKPCMKKMKQIPSRIESPINFDRIEYSILAAQTSNENHVNGYLIIKNNTLDILNEKSEILQTFITQQISEVNVHSPWDATLTKRSIGKPDVSMHIISTKLPTVLQTLENVFKCELYYDDPPPVKNDDVIFTNKSLSNDRSKTGAKEELLRSGNASYSGSSEQSSMRKQKDISENDAREISSVLKNIKAMALDVGIEQDAQIEQLDTLNQSVDRANARIQSADWKVKKLT